jgi:hypothetical protein
MNREFEVADPHAEWHELCALAAAGALEPAERERFRLHLAGCELCQVVFSDYRLIGRTAMPLVADEFAPSDEEIEIPAWDAGAAKQRLFAKLDQAPVISSLEPTRIVPSQRRRASSFALWAGLAACLMVALGVGCYQWGMRNAPPTAMNSSPLLARVQSITAEKTALDKRLDAENASLSALEKQAADSADQIAKLQTQLQDAQAQADSSNAAKSVSDQQLQSTTADRDSLAAKLQTAQQAYQSVQTELTNLRTQRQQELLHYASLDVEVTDLRSRLRDAQNRVNDDNQYLASDRDIREMMGARQLYIADVVDVDQNGNRRKPYGRVFLTKGKSLLFYAFDLDQQPGVRQASTFQAWAREGSDRARPVSLGIFYVDSEANRRWALKADDPKVLAEINSVFVTMEPKGGSQKPTSKPLLYAYLKTEAPNHP